MSNKEIWKHVFKKKKGIYGETDFEKKTITINKAKHKNIKKDKSIVKASRTMIDTMVHEEMHKNHPKMHEKTVRKLTPKKVKRMSKRSKKKLYNKYK